MDKENSMKTISVSELRANLSKVLKEIKHGSSKQITLRGQVVAKLVPPDVRRETAIKSLNEIAKTVIIGDVISPIDDDWEVMK